jgi:V-type H+-transporting ATPase subunit a
MLVGVLLSAMNYVYRKDWANIFFRFIPEFLILGCTFGYLSFMIILKWCINWSSSPTNPPDLIKTMTDFFLYPTRDIAEPLYPGQKYIQIILLLVAAISIFVLLIPLPFYQLYRHKQRQREIEESEVKHIGGMDIEMRDLDDEEEKLERPIPPSIGQSDEEFSFQEVLIKQLIHTIEYALGTVSHTASYLRLWALSLAHAQLSDVLFELTLGLALTAKFGNPIIDALVFKSGLAVFIAFLTWISLTMVVLLGMESLGAFLHALRLHWVEFQDKFYTGEGHAFTPFSYQQIYKETTVDINSADE